MPRLLSHLLDEAALRAPEALAVRCGSESLLYGDLARYANGMARALLETGLQQRDRVAVFLPKSTKVAISFYGVFASGGVLVPIDPKSPAEQVARIIRATGATRLITEPSKQRVTREALGTCPEITHVIGLEAQENTTQSAASQEKAVTSWETVYQEATDRIPSLPIVELDPAYVLHTSGSTGIPKLIQHTHHSAMSFVEWAAAEYALVPEDRLSNHSSHHTCFATFDYYAAARAGAATVLLTPAVLMMPGSLSSLLETERVSVWYSVPTALVQLLLRGGIEDRDLTALRWVLFAGETFPEKHLRSLMAQIPKARFSHVYGSTEVNVCTFYHLPKDIDLGKVGSREQACSGAQNLPIGKACSTSHTRVVDADLQPVPPGETGELLVRGSTVMSGYWNEPEKNEQALVQLPVDGGFRETYFRTGDRVQEAEDGNLAFVARADLQIKVRGFRVELGEVEAALLALDHIDQAAAFAVPDSEGSSAIYAAVVMGKTMSKTASKPSGNSGVSEETSGGQKTLADDQECKRNILADLRKILPLHSIPGHLAVLDSLPTTPTGKIDRNQLRKLLQT